MRDITSNLLKDIAAVQDDSEALELCEGYINNYYGDSNADPQENGEYFFLNKLLPFCRTVLDVGASGGMWASNALEINPLLTLHCFEPFPINQQKLMETAGGRAMVNGFAVGAEVGKMLLHVLREGSEDNWQLASLYQRNVGMFGATVDMAVDVLPLDHYCATNGVEHVDFLKIDVEGAEMDVLLGARGLFGSGRVMAAQVEYGATWLDSRRQLRDLFDFAAEHNYVTAKIMPDGYKIIGSYWHGLDSFRYSNWLLLHPDIAHDEVAAG